MGGVQEHTSALLAAGGAALLPAMMHPISGADPGEPDVAVRQVQCAHVTPIAKNSPKMRTIHQRCEEFTPDAKRSPQRKRVGVVDFTELFNCSTVQLFNCSTVQLFNCVVDAGQGTIGGAALRKEGV